MKTIYRLFSHISLSLLAIAILFALLELGTRFKLIYDDFKMIRTSQKLSGNNVSGLPKKTKQLRYLLRWNSNPRIIYELIPNLAIIFKNQLLTTNSQGFRGHEYSEKKDEHTIRIVGLGDSYMFGWRVADDEYYLALLSDYLNQDIPNLKFEIINTAVPGYNTVMEIETLKEKGLKYDPDIVIVHFTGNDFDLPNFIRKKANYFSIRKSYFLRFLNNRIRNSIRKPKNLLVGAPKHALNWRRFESDPDRVPDNYRDMVGEEAFSRAMQELKTLSREHDFDLILFSTTKLPAVVEDICANLKIPVVEAGSAIQDFMRINKIQRYSHSNLVISKHDDHPSPVSHRIFADVIYDHLKKSGVSTK